MFCQQLVDFILLLWWRALCTVSRCKLMHNCVLDANYKIVVKRCVFRDSCIILSVKQFCHVVSISSATISRYILVLTCNLLSLDSLTSKRYLIGMPSSQSWKSSESMAENTMLNRVKPAHLVSLYSIRLRKRFREPSIILDPCEHTIMELLYLCYELWFWIFHQDWLYRML